MTDDQKKTINRVAAEAWRENAIFYGALDVEIAPFDPANPTIFKGRIRLRPPLKFISIVGRVGHVAD